MTAPAATKPHALAVIGALTGAGLTASLAESATDALPRTVVYPAPGFHDGTLGDVYRDITMPFQTTAIGRTADQALWQHDKTVAALLGAKPSVSGRVPHPIYMDGPQQPAQRDDTGATPLFYVVALWIFHTTV